MEPLRKMSATLVAEASLIECLKIYTNVEIHILADPHQAATGVEANSSSDAKPATPTKQPHWARLIYDQLDKMSMDDILEAAQSHRPDDDNLKLVIYSWSKYKDDWLFTKISRDEYDTRCNRLVMSLMTWLKQQEAKDDVN